jgi:hypothetical protein
MDIGNMNVLFPQKTNLPDASSKRDQINHAALAWAYILMQSF